MDVMEIQSLRERRGAADQKKRICSGGSSSVGAATSSSETGRPMLQQLRTLNYEAGFRSEQSY